MSLKWANLWKRGPDNDVAQRCAVAEATAPKGKHTGCASDSCAADPLGGTRRHKRSSKGYAVEHVRDLTTVSGLPYCSSPRSVCEFPEVSELSDCVSEGSSTATSSSSFYSSTSSERAVAQWPIQLFTPFALIKTPLEPPTDFRGRSATYILQQAERQLAGLQVLEGRGTRQGGSTAADSLCSSPKQQQQQEEEGSGNPAGPPQQPGNEGTVQPAEILLGALTELERLSFKERCVDEILAFNAAPLFASIVRDAPLDSACKAAVLLWNLAYQRPAVIPEIKRTGVVAALADLLISDGQTCQAARYSTSGCLSVLTSASKSVRLQCGAVPGLLSVLVSLLFIDEKDINLQYHAGGCLYYIALNEPELRGEVRAAGAQAAFRRMLDDPENPNAKLAKRALACLREGAEQ